MHIYVQGCDGSVLLDGPNSEKKARQNVALGGFALIDRIKTVLEDRCPGKVSCADILQLATRDALRLVRFYGLTAPFLNLSGSDQARQNLAHKHFGL